MGPGFEFLRAQWFANVAQWLVCRLAMPEMWFWLPSFAQICGIGVAGGARLTSNQEACTDSISVFRSNDVMGVWISPGVLMEVELVRFQPRPLSEGLVNNEWVSSTPTSATDVIKSMIAKKAVNSQMLIIDRDRKLLRMRTLFGESSSEVLSSVGSGMVQWNACVSSTRLSANIVV